MPLHFDRPEFAARLTRLKSAVAERRLDGMLLFSQESDYWLTGYDTFGFCFFQSLVVTADGRMALLTRSADLRQAQRTSLIDDVRVWTDRADATPAEQLRAVAADLGLKGKRLGVEYDSHGLTAANGKRLDSAFDGFAILEDASDLVPSLRSVKSAPEIAMVREAARLSDLADAAALGAIGAGADEGEILAALQGAVFAGGGDFPANEVIIGSGADALLCRYKSGRRRLAERDQITLEFAGVFRHYHAALMRTVCVGEPTPRHMELHAAARAALEACEAEMRPGRTAGDVFSAHARILDKRGLSEHRLAACGYALGAKFTPSWMDPPMFFEGCGRAIEAGMVLFAHMILMDSASGTAMCLGRTYLVANSGPEALNGADTGLVIR